jgi:hypothetical protein
MKKLIFAVFCIFIFTTGNALAVEISWMHVQHRVYGAGKDVNRLGFGLIDDRGNYVTDNQNIKEVKLYDPNKKEVKMSKVTFDSLEEIFGTYDAKNSQWHYSKTWQFDSWFHLQSDLHGNLIWTWKIPMELGQLTLNHKTRARASIDIFKTGKNTGYFSIVLPVHLGYVFIPADVVQRINQKGDRFEIKIQLETRDKNNRTYSKPFLINNRLSAVSK